MMKFLGEFKLINIVGEQFYETYSLTFGKGEKLSIYNYLKL